MRENGLIQGRLEGNVRLELEVIRKTLANSQASKEACVLKEQKGKKKKKIRRQEDLVSINRGEEEPGRATPGSLPQYVQCAIKQWITNKEPHITNTFPQQFGRNPFFV